MTTNITVLMARDPRLPLAKHFQLAEGNEVRTSSYPNCAMYVWKQQPVEGIGGLHTLLQSIYRNRRCAIVRGVPTTATQKVTRRNNDAFPENPEGTSWVMLDIDGIPTPEGVAPCSPQAVEYVVSKLPQEFREASYVYEFSGSAGIRKPDGSYLKPGIRLHLFFWLNRPVLGPLLAAYLEDFCYDTDFYEVRLNAGGIPMVQLGIDMAPIRAPSQLHYTAEPMIDERIRCDITYPERLGLVEKSAGVVELPDVAPDLPVQVAKKRQETREAWATANGFTTGQRVVQMGGRSRRYTVLSPANPQDVRVGRELIDIELRAEGNVLGLKLADEKTPGSWYVLKRSPWLARRMGDGMEIPLEEFCPAAVETVRELGWVTEIREVGDEEVPPVEFDAFSVDEHGVWHQGYDKKGNPTTRVRLATPIIVKAKVRDAYSSQWSYLLKIWNNDSSCQELRIPAVDLTSENFRKALLDRGVNCNTSARGRELLAQFIQSFPESRTLTLVESTGWIKEDLVTFALPDIVLEIGAEQGADGYHLSEKLDEYTRAYGQSGTLEEWQEHVAVPCRGNMLLVLALSAAFLPPLLQPAGRENVGMHFRGPSSLGKSKLLRVASSVWGNPSLYVNSWRSTDNALETLASARNDALLTLDELGSMSSASAGDATYMLGNGQGKGRMRADASARPISRFHLVYLSSGEIGLNEHLREASRQSRAGHEVRFIDISADAGVDMGIVQERNGFDSSRQLVDHLDESSKQFFGTPIRAFLQHLLTSMEAKDAAARYVREEVRRLQEEWQVPGSDQQVSRVAGQLAGIGAAGELAIQYGILPFELGAAIAAAHWGFEAWLRERGGTESMEKLRSFEHLVESLHQYGSTRFEWWKRGTDGVSEWGGQRVISPQWGYGMWIDTSEENPQFEFWIPSPTFESVFCTGISKRDFAQYLVEKGYMDSAVAVNRRIPEMGTTRVYVIKGSILAGDVPGAMPEGATVEPEMSQ